MAAQHPILARLLDSNAQWARDVAVAEPSFFPTTAKGQAPKILWIGCADSRVPESVITACPPGDIFVHRNIANQFSNEDVSALSILQYAVNHVGVEHVIIAGHTGCGGAAACIDAARGQPVPGIAPTSPLNVWLTPLTNLASELLSKHGDSPDPLGTLVYENVRRQVQALEKSETMINAWKTGKQVFIHGWVYTLATGLITDLEISRGPSA